MENTLSVLAQRDPMLVFDLRNWLAQHPHDAANDPGTTAILSNADTASGLVCPGHTCDFLVHFDRAEHVALKLAQRQKGRPFVQMFHSCGQLLEFLAQPHAETCLESDGWQPWLMLPMDESCHARQWCAARHPCDWPWPVAALSNSPGPVARPAGHLGAALNHMHGELCQELNESIEAKLVNRPTPDQVLQSEDRPLRLLTLAYEESKYQKYCARDIEPALRELGVEPILFTPPMSPYHGYELLEQIDSHAPDVLLLNGRSRGHFPVLPQRLCIVSWDQDYAQSPSRDFAAQLAPLDRLMVLVRDWRQHAEHCGVPRERISHLNLGANLQIYYPSSRPVEKQYDILFVGHFHTWQKYQIALGFHKANPLVQKLLLEARGRLREWVAGCDDHEPFILPDFDKLLIEPAIRSGINQLEDPFTRLKYTRDFRYRIAHMLLREMFVAALAEFRLGLFGDGWQDVPQVADQAQAEIINGPALREAIHQSHLNLYLHTWTVHHPRLYDTAAAGGALLVGRVPEQYGLDEVFEVGREVDSFGSIAELKQKVRRYLDDPAACEAMGRPASPGRTAHITRRRRSLQPLQNPQPYRHAPADCHRPRRPNVPRHRRNRSVQPLQSPLRMVCQPRSTHRRADQCRVVRHAKQ